VAVWRTPELRRLLPDVDASDGFPADFDGHPGPFVERMMRTDARTYLIDDILQKVDRATMAVSLEGRNPLLDPAVAETALRSAATAAARPGEKPLLRATLALVLPPELVERPKMGFGVPLIRWFREDLRELPTDVLLDREASERGILRRDEVERLIREHRSEEADHSLRLWVLLQLEMWQREVLDSRRPLLEAA
jgi:asparagine synthase (glutamine-hydrolysing)